MHVFMATVQFFEIVSENFLVVTSIRFGVGYGKFTYPCLISFQHFHLPILKNLPAYADRCFSVVNEWKCVVIIAFWGRVTRNSEWTSEACFPLAWTPMHTDLLLLYLSIIILWFHCGLPIGVRCTRRALKVMPPIYFHGNYNRYGMHNNAVG
jgi:hypothetical protein